MSQKQIHYFPEKVLQTQAEPVEEVTEEIKKIVQDLADTLYASTGVGLAAPQIGINKQIIIFDPFRENTDQTRNFEVLINPVLINSSIKTELSYEGCKSIPDLFVRIPRSRKIVVRGINIEGKSVEITAVGLKASVIQHEIDHLKGKLIHTGVFESTEKSEKYLLYTNNIGEVMKRIQKYQTDPQSILYTNESKDSKIFVLKNEDQIQLYFSDKNSNKLSGIMSRIDVKHPLKLLGLYSQIMMLALAWNSNPKNIHVIGFGGGRLSMIFHHYFPHVVVENTELDSEVVELSYRFFGIKPDERMRIYVEDGRKYIESQTENHYDFIFVDAFSGSGIHPYELSTTEFYSVCAQRISDKSVVATNLIDTDPLFFEKAYTFMHSFTHVVECFENGTHIFFGSNSVSLTVKEIEKRIKKLDYKYSFQFPLIEHISTMRELKRKGHIISGAYQKTTVLHDGLKNQ